MKVQIVTAALALALITMVIPSQADAGPALLCPADLDKTINSLPPLAELDRVDSLKARLLDLEQSHESMVERDGLRLAISLIRIARQTKIASGGHNAPRPLVAGL